MATIPTSGLNPLGQPPPEMHPPDLAKATLGLSDERTPDAVESKQTKPKLEMQQAHKDALMWVIKSYTTKFSTTRRWKVRQVLRAREYLKGKQYISFDPYSFTWFDPMEAMFDGAAGQEDLSIYRYVNNIYQMLHMSFVGALTPQVPKARFLPADATSDLDVQTAKHASSVQAFNERKNKVKRMQKVELSFLWTDGCYFKYTRFVVDEDKAGTRKQPVMEQQDVEVMPEGYFCPSCNHDTPKAATAMLSSPVCEHCGSELSDANYHPAESDTMPVVTRVEDVPDGMVKQSVYGALNVIGAPWAQEPTESPILRLDEEVDTAAVRTSYPEAWEEAASGGDSSDDASRVARQYVLSSIGGRNNLTDDLMPTLSRTWVQPWAFAAFNDKKVVGELKQLFPKGVKVVHLGEKYLDAQAERMGDHWTWCGSMPGYGLYPPGVGDCALDVQDQFNDLCNIVMEFMDRSASPGGYSNESALSSTQMSNKPNLPGTFTGVKVKGEYRNLPLNQLFYQPEVKINDRIFQVIQDKVLFAELVTGVMPQVFGGGQQDIETMGGQRQALNVAMTRLGQYWDEIREEHATSAGLGVKCAAENYSGQIMDVIVGGPEQYSNKYIPVDELKGEFHSYSETDQGFPSTYAEIRDRIERLFTAAQNNQELMKLFDEPNNMRMAATYLGVPGLTIPGEATRSKVSQVLQQLVQSVPTSKVVPQLLGGVVTPVKVDIPTIAPDPDFDDLEVARKVVQQFAEENWEMVYTNPDGYANVRAYYNMVVEMQMARAQEDVMRSQAVQSAGAPLAGAAPGSPPRQGARP